MYMNITIKRVQWCSHIFTLFLSRKSSVIVEIFQLSFHVFVCAFCPEISSFSVRVSPFFLLFFELSILWYFPFHDDNFILCHGLQACKFLTLWKNCWFDAFPGKIMELTSYSNVTNDIIYYNPTNSRYGFNCILT